jgi:formylglycine-generating enzyme required for sulfatase activity
MPKSIATRAVLCAMLLCAASLSFGQVKGDVSGDGIVNLIDAAMIKDHLLERKPLTGSALTRADTDGDGKVRMADLVYVNNHFYKPPVKNISGWIALPSGTPLSPTGMKIIAPGGEAAIDGTWHFAGLPAWNTGNGQFVFVEDAAGSSTLMGYVDPSEVSTGTLIFTPRHIALGLIAMHPVNFTIDDRQRRELLSLARSNPNFPVLVALIVQALQTDPTHLNDYAHFPQIFELAGDIGNTAAQAWHDSSAPAWTPQIPTPFAQIGLNGDPHLEDWPANGMTFVNPHMLFYGIQWGTASNQWDILRGKDGVVQLIPPGWTPPIRKNVTLSNGDYLVNIYKGFGAFRSPNPAEQAAARANVFKTILLGVDALAPPGIPSMLSGAFNDNELIESLVRNSSRESEEIISTWDGNVTGDEDYLSLLKKIVKLMVNYGVYQGSMTQKVAHVFYRMADVDGRAWWRYFKNANTWLDSAVDAVKFYNIANEFIPFFYEVFLYPNHYAYGIRLRNGVLSATGNFVAPSARLTGSPANPAIGQSVSFDASASSDEVDPLSALYFRFDFEGDGSWDTAWAKGNPLATHAYSTVGPRWCKVEVRDSGNNTAQASYGLYVSWAPTGTVSIDATPNAGSWRLIGPAGFATLTGTGDRTGGSAITNCPAGAYTLSCNDNVAGYNPPPVETKRLLSGGTIAFTATYTPESGPNEITINLPGNVPLVLVRVPAGSFQMGSPDTERSRRSDEGPVHTVNIGYAFYMGKYELTQRQWLAVMGSWPGPPPSSTYGVGDNYPAYYVSWNDAQNFITALNTHITNTGQGPATFRLPSEAEWEYACRAGTQTRFFFGDSLSVDDGATDGPAGSLPGNRSDYMWFWFNCQGNANGAYGSKPVGTRLPNQFGLYDMHGNMWEWCQDWRHSDYTAAPTDGSAWESPVTTSRVIRAGSWPDGALYCRSAWRNHIAYPGTRYYSVTFRLVRTQ